MYSFKKVDFLIPRSTFNSNSKIIIKKKIKNKNRAERNLKFELWENIFLFRVKEREKRRKNEAE